MMLTRNDRCCRIALEWIDRYRIFGLGAIRMAPHQVRSYVTARARFTQTARTPRRCCCCCCALCLPHE